jgi:hypothetical protein
MLDAERQLDLAVFSHGLHVFHPQRGCFGTRLFSIAFYLAHQRDDPVVCSQADMGGVHARLLFQFVE